MEPADTQGTPAAAEPLSRRDAQALLAQVPGWVLSPDARMITTRRRFDDFASAMAFCNAVAAIADAENHHPELQVQWGQVDVMLSTHAVGGLSEQDFILAAKINRIAAFKA